MEMRLSLDVLKHLGLNLYSNVPAVLSEIVANSWDADAMKVVIQSSNAKIVIQDDGTGMTRDEVIDRFLLVGYQRREEQEGATKLGRSPMGRKGIGKLSLLSIANDIVVETRKDNISTALKLELDGIQESIASRDKTYRPIELKKKKINFEVGTRITLTKLRKKVTKRGTDWLRQRLARRFSIIGSKYQFNVVVNGVEVSPSDRGYFGNLQYIWTYGDQSGIIEPCRNLACEAMTRRNSAGKIDGKALKIDGWLGTVKESRQLKDDQGENLNRIAIFVRGKMAQEDLLRDFSERGVYASYLIGELRVDGLDTATSRKNQDDDSATTSRQRLVEDDPRYASLKKFIEVELKHIKNKWSDLRIDEGAKNATDIPGVKEWLDNKPRNQKRKAKQWIGKINQLNVDVAAERVHLIKHAAIAFDHYQISDKLKKLDSVCNENIEKLLSLFSDIDSLELVLYGQIVKERLEVIKTIRSKVKDKDKEVVFQKYIFDHLWLLDPAWERSPGSENMEKSIHTILKRDTRSLSKNERKGRIDIQYRTTYGSHVIVELKRPGIKVSAYDLSKQIGKYRDNVLAALEDRKTTSESINIICVLGEPPIEWETRRGQETVIKILTSVDARFITYDDLLNNAEKAYFDYLNQTKILRPLQKVIDDLDDYAEGIET